jgi:hypothetical protein
MGVFKSFYNHRGIKMKVWIFFILKLTDYRCISNGSYPLVVRYPRPSKWIFLTLPPQISSIGDFSKMIFHGSEAVHCGVKTRNLKNRGFSNRFAIIGG